MKSLRAFVVFTALINTSNHVSGYECSSCGYTALNCHPRNVTDNSTNIEETPIEVCNAQGQIQIDDVFCEAPECSCAEGKYCVSLVLGCRNMIQSQSRKRCLGSSAIDNRFLKCAITQGLVREETYSLNISSDWIYFREPHRCLSYDCQAVRRFHECGVVQCGYLIVAWIGNETLHLIVDGSRSNDMVGGTFLFTMDLSVIQKESCGMITTTPINDCYSLQTRNQKGKCDGIYLQADHTLQLKGNQYNFSKLSWPVWFAVVGSILSAIGSVAMVIIMYVRMRKLRSENEQKVLLLSKNTRHSGNEDILRDPRSSTRLVDLRQRSSASPTHSTSASLPPSNRTLQPRSNIELSG